MAITQADIDALEYVPNAPLRALALAALDQQIITSMTDLAERCGVIRKNKGYLMGDSTSLGRALGIKKPTTSNSDGCAFQTHMKYDLAVKIVRAVGASPVDYGV